MTDEAVEALLRARERQAARRALCEWEKCREDLAGAVARHGLESVLRELVNFASAEPPGGGWLGQVQHHLETAYKIYCDRGDRDGGEV